MFCAFLQSSQAEKKCVLTFSTLKNHNLPVLPETVLGPEYEPQPQLPELMEGLSRELSSQCAWADKSTMVMFH